MSRIIIFTCKECSKQTQMVQQAMDEPPVLYLSHICQGCKQKLFQKYQQLIKEREAKERMKKIQTEAWKASHCTVCDKYSSVYHYVYDKSTNELTQTTENATDSDNQWVFCTERHFKKWKKTNIYNCTECQKRQVGKEHFYNTETNDNHKFCSEKCFQVYYAPLCNQCQQKILGIYHYGTNDQGETIYCCLICYREIEKKLQEENDQQLALEIQQIIEEARSEDEKINYFTEKGIQELTIEQLIRKIKTSQLRKELLELWKQKRQQLKQDQEIPANDQGAERIDQTWKEIEETYQKLKESSEQSANQSNSEQELANLREENYQCMKRRIEQGETFLNETIDLWEIEGDKREELRQLNQRNKNDQSDQPNQVNNNHSPAKNPSNLCQSCQKAIKEGETYWTSQETTYLKTCADCRQKQTNGTPKRGFSTGEIAGMVIATCAFLALLIGGLVWVFKKRKK